MSHQITCRECNASNPPGSKFCSNCGAKLPPSTHMICPNCESANPHDRIFCDNCGTRLYKDATVPLDEDKPEKPGGRGAAFTLPARRPGETGELDPSLLPEWLRTGDTKKNKTVDEGEEEPEDLPEWLQKSVDDTKDLVKPEKLEDITSEKKGTDDLPDWLIDDSDSNPIIATPEEISTELYLDLVSKAEEDASEEAPIELSGANLPDWLSEASQISDTGKLSSDALNDEPEVADDEPDEEEYGMPEWLAAITEDGFDSTSSEGNQTSDISGLTELLSMPDEPVSEEEAVEDNGFTDWLSDSFPSEEETSVEQPGDAAESSGGLTDWLSDPFAGEDEPPPEKSNDEGGLTDWLSDPFASEEEPKDQPAAERGGLTDWLSDPFSGEEESPAQRLDDVDDWLSELDQVSESESKGTGSLEDLSDAPDWLLEEVETPEPEGDPPLDTSAGIADEIAQTLIGDAEHIPTDFAELFQVESTDDSDLPDWLAGAASSGDSFISQEKEDPTEALDNLFEKEEFAAQSELDWLMQTGGLNLPDVKEEDLNVPEELKADSTITDGFDWLSDLASLDTNTLQSAEESIDEFEDFEPEPAVDDSVSPEGEGEADDWSDTESFLASESQLREELPDWLPDLDSGEANEIASDKPDEVPSEGLPSWLDKLEPESGSQQIESEFSRESEAEAESDLVDEPQLDPPQDKIFDEHLPLAEDSFEFDEDSFEFDGSDSLPDEIPSVSQEEIVAGTIPDWLQDLKPDDSKSEDLSFMDEPAPVQEEELPLQKTGPLAGLRGVVGIEPAMTSVLPQQEALPFTITTEQQQQMELIRQLVQEKSHVTTAEVADRKRLAAPAWLRILLALLLLGAVVAGLLIPESFINAQDSLPEVTASLEAIDNVAGQPVLVAFEYSPGMAGELSPQANLVLQQLAENGSPIFTISQYTTGTALAETAITAAGEGINLGYLPGEAVGLRELGDCLDQNPDSCSSIPGWPQDDRIQASFSDVQLVILLTGHRDSFVYWVEQVAQPSGLPLVVGVTQSLTPVTLPYQASGQLAGVISGTPGTAVFDQLVNGGPLNPQLQKQLNAQTFAQLLIVILLLIGMITYGVISPLVNRSK
ncbi:MAG: hypothetical protein DWQ04_18420 [Chloroflexi bacterium]|nr:MAG: hypothetical protein DWQ04_18420 [Chloroflexota bacterium]